jgi:hypothetical protein
MAPGGPLLNDETMELLGSGVTIHVATADAGLRPEYTLGAGVRAHRDRRTVTVYVARVLLYRTLENIEANGRIAVALSRPSDHRSIQIKGRVAAVRDSGPADGETQQRYGAALVEQLAIVGVPRSLVRRLSAWPSVAIDIDVAEVYAQTPGPSAGARIAG